MNGYTQHAATTTEYQQGRNSAEWNLANPYGLPIHNPYESGGKQWLDWQIGYESFQRDIDAQMELKATIQKGSLLTELTFNEYKRLAF